ncbi:MAG: pseudouridine-5'-phosphate glycosidase, partial [Paracoccaceae bacterium]
MLNCQIAPNVAEALTKKTPIVALESTIITHGMPW